MCLEEVGCSVTPEMVDRLSGNNSAEKKESAMAAFQGRFEMMNCPGVQLWFDIALLQLERPDVH